MVIKSKILCGNSIELMEDLKNNSIHSLITDGPYGLGFMNKEWDKFTSKEYQDFCFEWGSKALKILMPGSLLLSFSAPRKYHRMVCGLEDAGFKIKDMINWTFGSGFPKSLDISKAIDSHFGLKRKQGEMKRAPDGKLYDKRKIIGHPLTDHVYSGDIIEEKDLYEFLPESKEAKQYEGWGTGLKPAQEPIVLAQKPLEGTYAENVLKWGVGGLNINVCRINYLPDGEDPRVYNESRNISRGTHETGTVKIAPDGNEMRMFKPNKGRWPSNFILTHHPECILIGNKEMKTSTYGLKTKKGKPTGGINTFGQFVKVSDNDIYGGYKDEIIENYQCHPDCPVRMLDVQSGQFIGEIGRANRIPKSEASGLFGLKPIVTAYGSRDKGGASRFFYCAKAHKNERNAGLDYIEETPNTEMVNRKENSPGINNPRAGAGRTSGAKNDIATLKPINLMRYLVRLITPPNGIVLDPFAGSGTTGIACIIEGFRYILIEKRERFTKTIIPKRLKYWSNPQNWNLLKNHSLLPKVIELKNKGIESYF